MQSKFLNNTIMINKKLNNINSYLNLYHISHRLGDLQKATTVLTRLLIPVAVATTIYSSKKRRGENEE